MKDTENKAEPKRSGSKATIVLVGMCLVTMTVIWCTEYYHNAYIVLKGGTIIYGTQAKLCIGASMLGAFCFVIALFQSRKK